MTPGALAIVMVTLSVRRGSSGALMGTKPANLGGRNAMAYFVVFGLVKKNCKEEGKKIIHLLNRQTAEM
jgi:hypothetical protein